MKAEEQRDIIQAYIDGKTIEFKESSGWVALGEAGVGYEFDFRSYDYRIAKTGEDRLIEALEVIKSSNNFTSAAYGVDRVLLGLREGKYRDE